MTVSEPEVFLRILEGVHRCVAAHMVGRTEVLARLDRGGVLGPATFVRLSAVYSPKPAIGRWDHRRDFRVLLALMADDNERDRLPPVELVLVPARVVKHLTSVAAVVVRDL